MKVGAIETFSDDGWCEIRATISVAGRAWPVFYRWNGPPCLAPADVFTALALQPAMRMGCDLEVEGAVSQRLLENSDAIQAMYANWNRRLSIIRVRPQKTHSRLYGPEDRGTASSFSGGVDSFYTLLKSAHSIETLIFAPFFDNTQRQDALQQRMLEQNQSVAHATGKRLLTVYTNLRLFSDAFVPWLFAYGAVLAGFGYLCAPITSRFIIPGAYDSTSWVVEGSTPELDPLWSTEDLEVVHDADDRSRFGKIEALVQNPLVQDHLRVCWSNSEFACCECPKCLRTMASLHILGELEHFPQFGESLDLEKLGKICAASGSARQFVTQNLQAARDQDADQAVIKALERSRARKYNWNPGWALYQLRLWLEERRRDWWRWRAEGNSVDQ